MAEISAIPPEKIVETTPLSRRKKGFRDSQGEGTTSQVPSLTEKTQKKSSTKSRETTTPSTESRVGKFLKDESTTLAVEIVSVWLLSTQLGPISHPDNIEQVIKFGKLMLTGTTAGVVMDMLHYKEKVNLKVSFLKNFLVALATNYLIVNITPNTISDAWHWHGKELRRIVDSILKPAPSLPGNETIQSLDGSQISSPPATPSPTLPPTQVPTQRPTEIPVPLSPQQIHEARQRNEAILNTLKQVGLTLILGVGGIAGATIAYSTVREASQRFFSSTKKYFESPPRKGLTEREALQKIVDKGIQRINDTAGSDNKVELLQQLLNAFNLIGTLIEMKQDTTPILSQFESLVRNQLDLTEFSTNIESMIESVKVETQRKQFEQRQKERQEKEEKERKEQERRERIQQIIESNRRQQAAQPITLRTIKELETILKSGAASPEFVRQAEQELRRLQEQAAASGKTLQIAKTSPFWTQEDLEAQEGGFVNNEALNQYAQLMNQIQSEAQNAATPKTEPAPPKKRAKPESAKNSTPPDGSSKLAKTRRRSSR